LVALPRCRLNGVQFVRGRIPVLRGLKVRRIDGHHLDAGS
jgi:hypothetical protein